MRFLHYGEQPKERTLTRTHTHTAETKVKPDSQGKQLGHVTEAVVGQRADLVVTQITEKETTTGT